MKIATELGKKYQQNKKRISVTVRIQNKPRGNINKVLARTIFETFYVQQSEALKEDLRLSQIYPISMTQLIGGISKNLSF